MNNIELEHCLITNKYTKKFFRGIYPSNEIIKLRNIKQGFYIVNTISGASDNGHWIGLNVTKLTIEVFDTSGFLFFINKYFNQFMNQHNNREFIFNTNMIQHPKSNICGYYCLVFALYRAKKKKFFDFVNIFHKVNLKYNDELAIKIFNKNFDKPICNLYGKNSYRCILLK